MIDSGGAVNVDDIPVAWLVPWAFRPRISSVRTHALVTGIVALSGGVDARDETGQRVFTTAPL